MANKILWNTGWSFTELPVEAASYQMPTTAAWNPVDIPHDWMIYQTHGLYRDSIGWYKKEFYVNEINQNQQTILRFDGVYMDSTVFVNGQMVGEWKYGYSTFEIDLSPYLKQGSNEVAVRVVYQFLNTRWYSGAGIYRNVWWKTRNQIHIESDGIYITTKKENNNYWTVTIDTELCWSGIKEQSKTQTTTQAKTEYEENKTSEAPEIIVKQQLYDDKHQIVAEDNMPITIRKSDRKTITQSISIQNPSIWDIAQGNLYQLITQLWRNGILLEEEKQRIGFRTLEFSENSGFLINGRHEKLNGVCEHHDFGCLGAVFHKAAMKRKFQMLRAMGVNAVRTSHNMPATELMELADEMGFLILSEAFDMWERSKTTYDYARFFSEWYEKDVASWVRRDRNHPSLLMWSIGNEIPDTLDDKGEIVTGKLQDAVRKNDPKRHAPVTIGSNFIKWENPQKGAELLDCVGYNYSEYLYEEHHKKHPNWIIYGSETASVLASRGIYHFPRRKAVLSDADEQCSSLGNTTTGWGAKSYDACICDDRDAKFSLGQFIWTGFDYLGESTPYNTKNSYYGQIDTAGFPKDSFFIFQSAWTDYKAAPMVHLFPYWDFNVGQLIDVQACTNAPSVELFVNGISQGRKEIDHDKGKELVALWQVPYQPGTIQAVAYDENGKIIAKEEHRSFTDPVQLVMTADRTELLADGQDLAFVTIEALDQDGNPVENAKNRVRVNVTGAGRLIGLDNGDSTDFDEHKGKSRRMFSGKLLAVIASKQTAGNINIETSSEGLKGSTLCITSVSVQKIEGVAANEENTDRELWTGGSSGGRLSEALHEEALLQNGREIDVNQEVPIRKIELICTGQRHIRKENDRIDSPFKLSEAEQKSKFIQSAAVTVEAKVYPKNATFHDLDWKVVLDSGIEVNFATLIKEGNKVTVLPQGDGEFRLRCSSKNGGFADSVQSSLEFSIEGMGTAAFQPYDAICTGLCDSRTERVAEGVEHGVNFLGSEKGVPECIIGYSQVDFGNYGSDEITVSIFANTNDPVQLQIWEGRPGDKNSTLLSDVPYYKKTEWMVFKEESFHLKKRLKGVTSLYFATKDSYQFKSFWFVKKEKSFSKLYLSENDYIYGDAYQTEVSADGLGAIEQIGNNVIIAFTQMNFGETGAHKIMLTSRSPLATSTIQLRYKTEEETLIQAIEVTGSKDYVEQTFAIEPLKGKGTVEFIFMPGSHFDWRTFQFQ